MDVHVCGTGKMVMDDQFNGRKIETARGDVGGDH
jgi:hypothetical protein